MVYSKTGEIRFDDICLEGISDNSIKLQKCTQGNAKQKWHYHNQVSPIYRSFLNKEKHLILDENYETCDIWEMYDC